VIKFKCSFLVLLSPINHGLYVYAIMLIITRINIKHQMYVALVELFNI